MRRVFVFIILAIVAAALLTLGIQYDTGYVKITYGHWLIESNLWVLVSLNLIALIGLGFVISTLKALIRGSNQSIRWFKIRPKRKANNDSQRGLLAFLEGDWQTAKSLLTQSAQHARMPLVNLLAAANAANQQGNHKESAQILKQAHELDGGSELAASLTQVRLHIENERYEAALAVLTRLRKQHPKHVYVLKLTVQVYRALEDWEHLVACFEGDLAQQLNLSADFERQAWAKLFATYATRLKTEQKNGVYVESLESSLAEVWQRVPSKYRFDEHVIHAYVRELMSVGLSAESEVILRKALEKSWSENLIDAYGRAKGKDATKQLLHAEKWLKSRPNSPRLLLALGRLSLRCELWGKAQEYFSSSLAQQPSLEASAELYRLSCHLNKPAQDTDKQLEHLMQQLHLPELPQPR
ncbi:hypothetical protein A3762_03610 [Oleiphilus sp. HI0125]|uniref:heme biosynthesis HemY N-terminal domain-containing protein n=1 Tax=Oleiphilus sp. HI0125 TaxID=1822266 RepID=UPI0007C391DB|nr:heme biosynthesis HemY N-terminal domain-containing protein [Oleiphilus sp. HI0125]KZZ60071.1 hypothetical protein A3762_03610 [Oleiphilus sp. HI0125]